jgi:hypothetical protein
MGIFDNKSEGNFVFAPKQGGASVSYVVTGELERVPSSNPKLTYRDKNQQPTGYYDILPVDDDKQLFISAWKLYFALKECNPDIGDTITISHPNRGEYKVSKSN